MRLGLLAAAFAATLMIQAPALADPVNHSFTLDEYQPYTADTIADSPTFYGVYPYLAYQPGWYMPSYTLSVNDTVTATINLAQSYTTQYRTGGYALGVSLGALNDSNVFADYTMSFFNGGVQVQPTGTVVVGGSSSTVGFLTRTLEASPTFSFDEIRVSATIVGLTSGGNTVSSITTLPNNWAFASFQYYGELATPPGDVPEPASWVMMLGGFGLIGGALRARRRASIRYA